MTTKKHNEMKKIIVSAALAALTLCTLSAQDLSQVTDIYNTGATALSSGDREGALKSFEQALSLAEALGEEGADVVTNCKDVIPNLYLAIAKDLVKSANYDAAVEKAKAAIEVAKKFGDEGIAVQATDLIPQIALQKGSALLNAKKYTEAAAAYKEVLDAEPTNGVAALRLGMAYNGAGQAEEAKAALETALANGQEKSAGKLLGTIYLKEAASALKAKDYGKAVETAVKSCEYTESAQAYQIAAQASQISNKNDDAIKHFEKYLELSPNAKNATQIAYIVGTLYQQQKNNAKAVEFYSKAVNDPTYGAEAKKQISALK